MKQYAGKERESKWAEYEARQKREEKKRKREELNHKLAKQKAHWERKLAEKSADGECVADGGLTREEINIKIIDKIFKAYESSGEKDLELYLLLFYHILDTGGDPYGMVAFKLKDMQYKGGSMATKELLAEIAIEFEILSHDEIMERYTEERKRKQIEELTPKLVEQKAHWERKLAEKSADGECVADGGLTREEINIKIIDKIFKAYESSGGESYELNSLLDDLLDRTHRDPYEWVAYNLQYSVGDKKELLEEIAVEFEIPSYEEIEKREKAAVAVRKRAEATQRKREREERERKQAEAEARQKREQIEELTPKLVEQKARWKHALVEKSTRGECATEGSLTREEINIKILDKLFKAYEAFGGKGYGLYSLLDDMLHDTHYDPYKAVAYNLQYSVGEEKELLKEIVVEFDIPSYEEIEKRERMEELNPKLAKQKAHWERVLAKKSVDDDDRADGSLTREEINIKILDKVSKAYEEPGDEDDGLYLLLRDILHGGTTNDPYKRVAYELRYSIGDMKLLLEEIVDEFDIPSYEEIEKRDQAEEDAHWERKWAEEDARRKREEIAGGIINACVASLGFIIGFIGTILFKNPPRNNSQ